MVITLQFNHILNYLEKMLYREIRWCEAVFMRARIKSNLIYVLPKALHLPAKLCSLGIIEFILAAGARVQKRVVNKMSCFLLLIYNELFY